MHVLKVSDTDRRLLHRNAVELVWPIVFDRMTRRLELIRGHHACATSIHRLEPACLDRFHDDVEAAVDDLFRHAKMRIFNLEGWVSKRLNAATIDAYRRRRAQRGALQRPRLPHWLTAALGNEPRLTQLALAMLDWVGIDAATATLWPLVPWAERRAVVTGDYEAAYRSVAEDVSTVLVAMQQHPKWYADFIERPLAHKAAPARFIERTDTDPGLMEPLLTLRARQQEDDDARLQQLAAMAVDEIVQRIKLGRDQREAVVEVLVAVFGHGTAAEELDRLPGESSNADEVMYASLADPATIDQITSVVLDLLRSNDSEQMESLTSQAPRLDRHLA